MILIKKKLNLKKSGIRVIFSRGISLSFEFLNLLLPPFPFNLHSKNESVGRWISPNQCYRNVCCLLCRSFRVTGIVSLYRWSSCRTVRFSYCPQGLARTWTRAVSLLLVLPAKCWDCRCVPPYQATQRSKASAGGLCSHLRVKVKIILPWVEMDWVRNSKLSSVVLEFHLSSDFDFFL